MKKFLLLAVLLCGLPAVAQLDQYGGATAQSCDNATSHFILEKLGNRWWFCTPAGHVFWSASVGNLVPNGSSTLDCQTNSFNKSGTTLSWTLLSGSVYQAAITWTPVAVYQDGMGFGGTVGTKLTQAASVAAMAAGTWFYTAGTLSVWTTTGDSPATHALMNFPTDTSLLYIAKYGDANYNWGWQTEKRMQHWGFNSVGNDANAAFVGATATCNGCLWPGGTQPLPMPRYPVFKPGQGAITNASNWASQPVKSLIQGVNATYAGFRETAVDPFDPNFDQWWKGSLAGGVGQAATDFRNGTDAWYPGMMFDDTDYVAGSGAGPDFYLGPGLATSPNIGWLTLIAAPVMGYINGNQSTTAKLLYPDSMVYAKAQALDTVGCAITNPCSLRDYLKDKYSTVASLNAAWGSNYTTFDSTSTAVVGEVVGTGNGAQTVFTHTLAHPADPESAQFFVGGVLQAGDCPWFENFSVSCKAGGPTLAISTGTLGSPTANYLTQLSSSINYTTGAVTLTFVTPPSNGTAITVNYAWGGWMQGGTGLLDESGAGTWVGSNAFCLQGADPDFPTYFACDVAHNPLPKDAFRVAAITVSGATANIQTTAAYSFHNGSQVYLRGTAGYPAAACDVGPVSITVVNATNFTIPSSGCVAAVAGGWASSALAVDVDNWVSEYFGQYFKVLLSAMRAINPVTGRPYVRVPSFGLDLFGNGGSPASKFVLQAWAAYGDYAGVQNGAEVGLRSTKPTAAGFPDAYRYTTKYLGDMPLRNWDVPLATADSALACSPHNTTSESVPQTQQQRGLDYANTVSLLLNALSYNGDYPYVSQEWWSWQDFQGINQGIVSIHDNAYDGVEALEGSQACESFYTSSTGCGGESGNFGNSVGQASTANRLWLQSLQPAGVCQ